MPRLSSRGSSGVNGEMSLAAASEVLARHTATPDAGVAAIWEGWGGLESSAGAGSFAFTSSDGLATGFADEASEHPGDPELGSGVLDREIATGPRFDLHGSSGRHYLLFAAGANGFADVAWPERGPRVDDIRRAQSPSILWPDEHSWVLATEIDFDSTLVAGTTRLIHELLQTPGLEVLLIRPDADLSWGGDQLNRPA